MSKDSEEPPKRKQPRFLGKKPLKITPNFNFNKRQRNWRPQDDPIRARNIQLFRQALQLSGAYSQPTLVLTPKEVNSEQLEEWSTKWPQINVVPLNCLTAIRQARAETANCAVLNMASFGHPGGGVTRGAQAQEEFLCRVSNLYPALKKAEINGHYPLIQGFRHEGVTFFRQEDYSEIDPPEQPFQADVITISALRLNHQYEELKEGQKRTIQSRIRQLLELCVGYDIVVLSAFGCGAFHNPPDFVASCFKDWLIDRDEFKGKIGHIIFAIIEDKNSCDNYQTFKMILDPDLDS